MKGTIRRPGRKDQIYEVATKLFRERGYRSTSMRDLASAVGVEAASLYSHIKSKEGILKKICFDIAGEFDEAMNIVLEEGGNPEQMLRNAIREHIVVITRNLNASAVFLHDWRHLNEEDLNEFINIRKKYEDYLIEILDKGRDIGFFMIGDIRFTVRAVMSSVNWIYDWYQPDGKYSPQQIADRLCMLILNGLKFKY